MRSTVREQSWNLHYNDVVLSTNPIAYWPLDEKVGTVAWDWVSGRVASAQNGAHTGVTLGEPGIGDGMTSAYYDGVSDYTNIYTVPFAAAFNGSEGSVMFWWKLAPLAFNDGLAHALCTLYVDANNALSINRAAWDVNSNIYHSYTAGGVTETYDLVVPVLRVGFSNLIMTWSKTADQVIYYDNGVAMETDITLGIWAGALDANGCVVGAGWSNGTSSYYGWLVHPTVWNRPLTAGEVDMLYKARY